MFKIRLYLKQYEPSFSTASLFEIVPIFKGNGDIMKSEALCNTARALC